MRSSKKRPPSVNSLSIQATTKNAIIQEKTTKRQFSIDSSDHEECDHPRKDNQASILYRFKRPRRMRSSKKRPPSVNSISIQATMKNAIIQEKTTKRQLSIDSSDHEECDHPRKDHQASILYRFKRP